MDQPDEQNSSQDSPSSAEKQGEEKKFKLTRFQLYKSALMDILTILATDLTMHSALSYRNPTSTARQFSSWMYPSLAVAINGLSLFLYYLLLCPDYVHQSDSAALIPDRPSWTYFIRSVIKFMAWYCDKNWNSLPLPIFRG